MLCSVKGHVFKEMGQAVLVVLFLHCPHVMNDMKFSPVFRILGMTNVIGQPVIQLPDPYIGIHRNCLVCTDVLSHQGTDDQGE